MHSSDAIWGRTWPYFPSPAYHEAYLGESHQNQRPSPCSCPPQEPSENYYSATCLAQCSVIAQACLKSKLTTASGFKRLSLLSILHPSMNYASFYQLLLMAYLRFSLGLNYSRNWTRGSSSSAHATETYSSFQMYIRWLLNKLIDLFLF